MLQMQIQLDKLMQSKSNADQKDQFENNNLRVNNKINNTSLNGSLNNDSGYNCSKLASKLSNLNTTINETSAESNKPRAKTAPNETFEGRIAVVSYYFYFII